jgi:pyruvate/2-oxoglutarate dehydrogenase complex dihydrolipoamide dehydrogenase (E3) component
VERWLKGLDNCTVLEGHGRFETPHQVRVGDQLLEAAQIFVNVGARVYIPPLPGLDQVDYLTNSGIMRLDTLPDHLVIKRGGYIGLEFAQMYRRFGSQVTLIEMGNRLIRRESEDVSLAAREILEAEGVTVR